MKAKKLGVFCISLLTMVLLLECNKSKKPELLALFNIPGLNSSENSSSDSSTSQDTPTSETTTPTVNNSGLTVGSISGNTTELGGAATFTVYLNSQPTGDVSVCLESDDTTNGGDIVVSGNVNSAAYPCDTPAKPFLTFTTSNWSTSQTVTIAGVRGTVGQSGNTSYKILLTTQSSDSNYSGLSSSVDVTNQDIDIAGFYYVLVSVTGLNGTLIAQNNLGDDLTLTSNATYSFSTPLADGSSYSVSINSGSSGQVCAIAGTPYGTISGNHVTLSINCVDGYIFSGTILSTSTVPTLNQSFANLVTLAGQSPTSPASGNTDGIGSIARFNNPIAITTDGTNIYVADIFNNSVRQMSIATNSVTTLASGTNGAHGIATDGTNVYVSSYNQHVIRKVVISTGAATVLAGTTGSSGNVNGVGAAAKFSTPTYLTTDGTFVYVTDRGNSQIRKIEISTGTVTTLATGFNQPNGITTDGTYLYVADTESNIIKRITIADGTTSTIAGTGTASSNDNSVGLSATFSRPYGLTMDGSYLYILEGTGRNLRKMELASPNGVTTIMARNDGYQDGAIGTAKFCSSTCDSSVTTDGIYLYLSDRANHSIRRLE
ncbi:MAG: hypothetical protein H7A23_24360 [Leptospiraceae bacterium]|nr:hypothetical protein [Leptospiraceae bacterium]MCP5497699.1 hypothetical protein [Leptospiraceae bacterium]